jgi:hypothetical protein
VLVAILLIPVGMSSLRGLTHLLTCRDQVATPFTMTIVPGADPVIATSARFSREDTRLCGGLAVDLRARRTGDDSVVMIVLINNSTPSLWLGTVQLQLQQGGRGLHLPLDVGRIPAGSTRSADVPLRLAAGTASLGGSLLIGP